MYEKPLTYSSRIVSSSTPKGSNAAANPAAKPAG